MRKLGLALCSGAAAIALLAGCGSPGSTTAQPGKAQQDNGARQSPGFTNLADLVSTLSTKQSSAKTAKVSIDGSAGAEKLSGTGAVDLTNPASPAMQMDMNTQGQRMTMVFKDKVSYVKLPGLPGGKPWAKIDGNGSDPMSQMFGKMMSQMGDSADPTKTLDQLKNNGTLTATTADTVDGAPATHYSIQLDTQKLMQQKLDSMKGALGNDASVQDKIKQMLATMPKTLPAEVWVNDQQLPVKFQMTVPTPAVGGKTAMEQTTVTTSYHDWGQPVTITVPPADQVEDLSAMLGKLGGR